MSKIKYYKRIVNGTTKELHYQEDCGEFTKGKSYPESEENFNVKELKELELDEWLDEGLKLKLFNLPSS